MATLVRLVLLYLAIGVVLFAHPDGRAGPEDFHWRSQLRVFRATLPEVVGWPLALWRFCNSLG